MESQKVIVLKWNKFSGVNLQGKLSHSILKKYLLQIWQWRGILGQNSNDEYTSGTRCFVNHSEELNIQLSNELPYVVVLLVLTLEIKKPRLPSHCIHSERFARQNLPCRYMKMNISIEHICVFLTNLLSGFMFASLYNSYEFYD